jgi:hypothetical protein
MKNFVFFRRSSLSVCELSWWDITQFINHEITRSIHSHQRILVHSHFIQSTLICNFFFVCNDLLFDLILLLFLTVMTPTHLSTKDVTKLNLIATSFTYWFTLVGIALESPSETTDTRKYFQRRTIRTAIFFSLTIIPEKEADTLRFDKFD